MIKGYIVKSRMCPSGWQRSLKSLVFELDLKNRIRIVGGGGAWRLRE